MIFSFLVLLYKNYAHASLMPNLLLHGKQNARLAEAKILCLVPSFLAPLIASSSDATHFMYYSESYTYDSFICEEKKCSFTLYIRKYLRVFIFIIKSSFYIVVNVVHRSDKQFIVLLMILLNSRTICHYIVVK